MLDRIFLKTYPAPPIDEGEILRYAGWKGEADENIKALLEECITESESVLSYRLCYRVFDVKQTREQVKSQTVRHYLDDCEQAVAFAATMGLGLDRLIARYSGGRTAKALLLQALGAERIEALCDAFCQDLKTEYEVQGLYVGRRFSPGYGDFPLQAQKEIFTALDCPRKIGLTLTDSFLMSPTKSVTAIVGLSERRRECENVCAACEKTDCGYRK